MADTIDINVYPTVEEVTIDVTENLTTININQVTSTGAVTSVNGLTGAVTLDIPDVSGLVPYTGANNNVDIDGYTLTAKNIITKFGENSIELKAENLTVAHTAQWQDKDYTGIADITDIPDISGKMDISVYDTDASGVVDNSEKMTTIGRNSSASILYKGTIVYISGSTGNRPNFVKAQANSESASSGTFGVCIEDIAINSDGKVATIGTLGNLDTRTTATNPFTSDTLADGDTIYLSPTTAGYVTNTKPSAPNHIVYIGKVVRTSPTLGTIVYRIQNGYELEELHNVAISSITNRDILQYESASSLWKNVQLTTSGIVASADKNFVTDTQLTDINTIGDKLSGFLYKTTTTVPITGSTSETQAIRIEIPANTFSASDDIMTLYLNFSKSGTVGNSTWKAKLSTSATMPSGTTSQIGTGAVGNTVLYAGYQRMAFPINGGNIYGFPFTTTTGNSDLVSSVSPISSQAFDVTVTNYLYISFTNGSSADTVTLRAVKISNL